jgi:MYXO-CTERM domain-containing protein
LPATIEGELTAVGDLDVLPAATLENLGDMNFNPPVTITFGGVKVRKHYSSEAKKYVFENKMVHIPLPNINKFIHETDGGYVAMGTEGHVNAVAQNTGESALLVRLESSDPKRFVVPSQAIEIGPKSQRSLDVVFRPEGLGAASATIKAFTNDPDTPELTFEVKANGTPSLDDDRNGGKDDAGPLADGCGCRVVGGSGSSQIPMKSGYAALAGLGLALGVAASRRRKR